MAMVCDVRHLLLGASLLLLTSCDRTGKDSLASFVRSDLAMIELDLQRVTLTGTEWNEDQNPKAESTKTPVTAATSATSSQDIQQSSPADTETNCPHIVGGDFSRGAVLSGTKFTESCPARAKWKVIRHPIAFSLYFLNSDVLAWMQTNPEVKAAFSSTLIQGILQDVSRTLSVRAEDLNLSGLKGAFLREIVSDALNAEAEIHYDIAHGKKGFVLSCVREKAAVLSRALPILLGTLVRSGYRLEAPMPPVYEMRLGLQRVFITERKGRIFLSNSLEALINVLESNLARSANPTGAVQVKVRAEAFFDKLLRPMVGKDEWHGVWSFALSENISTPVSFQLSSAQMFQHLRDKTFEGVYSAVPQDVFLAVVSSFALPSDFSPSDWNNIASFGKTPSNTAPSAAAAEGGLALVWDLSSSQEQGLTEFGVIIANSEGALTEDKLRSYFVSSQVIASCAGGTVLLASTSDRLLVRMRESCEGQSLSIRDWKKVGVPQLAEPSSQQLMIIANPAVAAKELMMAGGAATILQEERTAKDPLWKAQYREAVLKAVTDGEHVFSRIPVIGYAGKATTAGADLQGFVISSQQRRATTE